LIFIRTESKGHRVPQATPRRSSSCTSYNAPSRSLGAACSRRRIGHGATSHIFILSSPDGGGTQPRRALSGGARGGKDSATQDQGLKFRRNFAEIRRKISFSLVTGEKNSAFFGKFRLKIQNLKKFGQNSPKFAEIYRNFGTKFRFR